MNLNRQKEQGAFYLLFPVPNCGIPVTFTKNWLWFKTENSRKTFPWNNLSVCCMYSLWSVNVIWAWFPMIKSFKLGYYFKWQLSYLVGCVSLKLKRPRPKKNACSKLYYEADAERPLTTYCEFMHNLFFCIKLSIRARRLIPPLKVSEPILWPLIESSSAAKCLAGAELWKGVTLSGYFIAHGGALCNWNCALMNAFLACPSAINN